jgi:hypothetical protein
VKVRISRPFGKAIKETNAVLGRRRANEDKKLESQQMRATVLIYDLLTVTFCPNASAEIVYFRTGEMAGFFSGIEC